MTVARTLRRLVAFSGALLLLAATPSPPHSPPAETYPDAAAISAAAGGWYFGGFSQDLLSKGPKEVVVIIGMPTSGMSTSHVQVFERVSDGSYRLILTRATVYGLVQARGTDAGIEFTMDGVPFLVLPWTGVGVGLPLLPRGP